MSETAYEALRRRVGEIADVNSAIALMHWDQEVMMPPKAAPGRGQQLATLSALSHRMFTSDDLGNLIRSLHDQADTLPDDDAKLVAEALYDYDRATKLPESFVHEFAEEQSKAFVAWVAARKESNFATFQPHLEKLLSLLKQKADLMGYEGSPYNALLEDYERGMTAEQLRDIFGDVAKRQSDLLARVMQSGKQPDVSWTEQDWDEQAQWDFSIDVIRDLGYDLEAGRQDKSIHPFTTNFDLYDVRVTTRVNHRELFSCLTGSIHECGHALYEQGFLDSDRRGPLGHAISLGIHESQSRMWENMIGRSLPFWQYYMDAFRNRYPGQLDAVAPEQVHAAINKVEPSFIRVEADECTYNLHIIIRFEIEVDLLEGNISVADVPEVWNAKMKEYLGLDVPSDAMGCLQDIHWSHGSMGYFPTYALGNLYAAQMFEQIEQDLPDLWGQIGRGEFAPLLGWLREHVHQHGRRKLPTELVEDISGKTPSADPYIAYLENKYGALYGL